MTDSPYRDGLPGYYDHAPETSRAAAESIAKVAASIRVRVLAVVNDARANGATGDDVATALGLTVHQVRSRIAELRKSRKIADSNKRRHGASGRATAVWCLPEYVDETPPASLTSPRGV